MIGNSHTAYQQLVAELGLTLIPSYVAEPGELTYVLHEGTFVGDTPTWFSTDDHRSMRQVEHEFAALAATVDPDDPWSHPDAVALDDLSVTSWLGSIGATPNVRRALEAGQLGLSSGSFERTSLLALLRKCASTPSKGLYSYDEWENLRVAEGSATVALRMADELDGRIRLGSPVRAVKVATGGCTVQLESGEIVSAGAVVSALPAGPFRDLVVEGVSDARLESLHRQRHALAAKFVAAYDRPFWRDRGQNGLTESEGILGSSWPQNEGVLSCLVPPERFAAYLSTAARHRREEALAELGDWFGPEALTPIATYERLWGTDRWTQGYVTQWRPGDVHRVGPCTAPTSRRSTCAAPISGWPATWRARCAPGGRLPQKRWCAADRGRAAGLRRGQAHLPQPRASGLVLALLSLRLLARIRRARRAPARDRWAPCLFVPRERSRRALPDLPGRVSRG